MRQENYEMFLKMPTEVVTRTNFKCAGCGKCCKHRGDLIVMTMDVFRICKYLGISVKEFMDKYAIKENDGKRMPKLYLKHQGDTEKTCIFLQNNRCIINPVKPPACYRFPFIDDLHNDEKKVKIQINECTIYKGNFVGEKRPIQDVLEEMSNGRFLSEKDLLRRFIDVVSEIDGRAEISTTSRRTEILDHIYEMLYNVDLKADMKKWTLDVLDRVEDIIVFL